MVDSLLVDYGELNLLKQKERTLVDGIWLGMLGELSSLSFFLGMFGFNGWFFVSGENTIPIQLHLWAVRKMMERDLGIALKLLNM